jgi:nitrogen-specific signal transduction histidine kinase/CheY-like chemotaxis protein
MIIFHYTQEVMKKFRRLFLMLFVLILSGLLASCINSNDKTPVTLQGIIDLSNYDYTGQNLPAFMVGVFVIICVYNLLLFRIRRTDKTYLCFSLLSIIGAAWILISQQYFIPSLFSSLASGITAKIEYINLILALIVYGRFVQSQYKEEFSKYPIIIMDAFGTVLLVLILFTEGVKYIHIAQVYVLVVLIYLAYVFWVIIKALKRKRNDAATLLIVSIILIFTILNDIAKRNGIIIFDEYLSLYGLFIFILIEAIIILKRFLLSFRDEEALAMDIQIKKAGLEKTVSHLDTIFNSMSSMLVLSDSEGRITRSNLAAQNSFSILPDNKIPQIIWDLNPFSKKLKTDIRDASLSHTAFEAMGEHLKENESRHYNIFLNPLIYEKTSGAVLRIDDITELEKKDEQLKHSERMEAIGTLAGGLTHDFNNILTGITGTSSLVGHYQLRDKKYVSKTLERLILIEQAVGKAVILVNRIMALAKRQDFNCTSVDLNQVINNVTRICKNTFDKGISIITQNYPEEAYIYADPTQIEQVMINLCLNAHHAMTIMRKNGEKWGGVLKIMTSRIDPESNVLAPYPMLSGSYCWAVDVSDTGVGIDDDMIKRIFEPFFTTKETGTGLGLLMVSNIIQQHGGVIEVKSGNETGTVFRIILPLYYPKHIEQTLDAVQEELPKGEGLILLAEDDDILKKSTRDILGLWGYEVAVADYGVEALKFFKKRHNNIKGVIMNLTLPRISGKELYLEMKKIDADVKVIVVSGIRPDPGMLDILRADGNGFIELPYSMMELLKKCLEVFSIRGGE